MLSKLLNVRPVVKLHYYSVFNKAAVNQAQLTKHLVLIPETYSELCHPYIVKPVSWSFAASYGFYCRKPVPKLVQEFIDLAQKVSRFFYPWHMLLLPRLTSFCLVHHRYFMKLKAKKHSAKAIVIYITKIMVSATSIPLPHHSSQKGAIINM